MMDTPSKHVGSMAIAALGRRLYEKSWNEYSDNDCQRTTRVVVLYDLATELAEISRAIAANSTATQGRSGQGERG